MSVFRTYLFDLDGTLIDHFAAIHRAHSHTLQALGFPAPTFEQVRSAVGGGLERAIGRLAGPERVEEALAIYRPYWNATMLDDVKLLPGARELLERLHGRGDVTAVLTNKHGPSSRLICEHLDITRFLNGVYGAVDTPWLKPQPEFGDYALEQLGANASTALLVGDSPWDVEAGENGGFPSWCVTTGTHTAAELEAAGADKVFPDLVALSKDPELL
ncbi:MAG: HAD family hydrolase [Opitutus sp.]